MLGLKSIRIITLMGVEHVTDVPRPSVQKFLFYPCINGYLCLG